MNPGTALTPEEERRSHGVASAVAAAVLYWYPIVGPVGAWTIHLVSLTALVRYTCNTVSTGWILHAITAGTLVLCAAAVPPTVRLMRSGGDSADGGEPGRDRFLGELAALVVIINVLLIVAEEAVVLALWSRRCG
jgi:hypothetical protein